MTEFDVSNFDIGNVTDMEYMFSHLSTNIFVTIYAAPDADWSVSSASSNNMFYFSKVKGGNGTSYNSSYTDKTRACVDGLNGKPGYFTAKSE